MRINEVRELNGKELQQELNEQERSLMNLRFRMATLQLSDSNQIMGTRRTIARIRTVMRERQIVAQYNLIPSPPETVAQDEADTASAAKVDSTKEEVEE